MPARTTLTLLGSAAAIALAAALAPGALAQSPGLHSLDGVVRHPAGDPVAGAEVTLVPVDPDGGNRTTRTDDAGRYEFRNLSDGTYDLTADADCCGPDYRQVTISGTSLSRSADLHLTDQREPAANETVILRGRTQSLDQGEAVGDVRLQVRSLQVREAEPTGPDGEEEPGHGTVTRREETFVVRSDADGTYAVELPSSRVRLEARKDGYDVTEAGFPVDGDRRVDVPVRASETPAARLGGVLRSDEGAAIAGADVNVQWDPECEDGRCPNRDPPDDASRESDGVRFHIDPAAGRYDSTTTGPDGLWNLSVHPGTVRLRVRHPDHLPARERFEVQGGEERRVNLTLVTIPEDSVRIHGRVTDAATGDPVPGARVQVENKRWGTSNDTRTGEDGTYTVMARPGYTVVTVVLDRDHGCARAHAQPVAREADGDRTAGSTVVRPDPCPEEEQGRDRGYLPRHRILAPEAGDDLIFSPVLRPAPARSSTIRGWVLNASRGEGIEGLTLTLRNEVTGDLGWATTDGDGSFTVNVTPGYYSVRAPERQHEDEYFRAVRDVEVGPEETRTMAMNLTPGSPPDRCCVVYDASPAGGDGTAEGQAGGAGSATAGDPSTVGGTFRGSGGDLGPYDPSMLGSSRAGGDGRGAPGPGLAVAAAAGLAAALAGRWRRLDA